MREILFRGRRIDNGEWVEGAYYLEPYTDKAYIIRWNSTGMGFNEFVEVEGDTIGQYTGLKDRYGLYIFEGDILKEYRFGNKNFIHVVCFGESSFGTSRVVNEKYDTLFIPFDDLDNIMCTWLESEVIGNIHDNPELLKEGQR